MIGVLMGNKKMMNGCQRNIHIFQNPKNSISSPCIDHKVLILHTNGKTRIVTLRNGSIARSKNITWRVSAIAEPILIEEYALSYYENYFSDDNEVHVIVNFTYNTSTTITCLGSILDVTIHEYVDKEEHDAKKMSSGMVLSEYYIYLDNGDIEQIQ